MKHTLFVYGTLKQNCSNNHLLQTAKFLGEGRTQDNYAMYVQGIPYVLKIEQRYCIHGELYVIDNKTLRRLDALEGHPDWYRREQVAILDMHNQVVTAWMYLYPDRVGKLNPDGRYTQATRTLKS
ncbi:MAG: gamma-glutamylcyclotransferase [Clostridia bacterium]|nr:gamma-glutamylcyclotransferase [Clostridia bacterium]